MKERRRKSSYQDHIELPPTHLHCGLEVLIKEPVKNLEPLLEVLRALGGLGSDDQEQRVHDAVLGLCSH